MPSMWFSGGSAWMRAGPWRSFPRDGPGAGAERTSTRAARFSRSLEAGPAEALCAPGWDVNTPIQVFGALFVGESGWIHVGRQGYLQAHPHRSWTRIRRSDGAGRCRITIEMARVYPDAPAHGMRCGNRRPGEHCGSLGCIAHMDAPGAPWDPARRSSSATRRPIGCGPGRCASRGGSEP